MNKKILSFLLLGAFVFNTNNFILFANQIKEETPKEQIEKQETGKEEAILDVSAKSSILIEATTGKVLYEKNSDEKLSPASVTKVMTLYLIYESIKEGKIKWEDVVTVSEYAASMGGSQIFLEPMEKQDVKTLTKSIVIASANDAAVAMAEYIAGSEEEFVKLMNQKAKELGMENTNFENACGLDTDTTNHYMSARDIAIVSKELMTKHPEIKEFTTKWQDTITHKTKKGETEFGLTNTNKLLKMYDGATGLKTGSTKKALYCLSGSAERDGLSLIAVVMASPDPKERFKDVAKVLDYGFANYQVVECDNEGQNMGSTSVYKGKEPIVNGVLAKQANFVIKKGASKDIQKDIQIIQGVKSPISKGTKIGEVIYTYEGNEIGRIDILAEKDIEKASLNDIFKKLIIDWVI